MRHGRKLLQIITGPTAPFSLSGLIGGWDGQVIEIVNLSGQQMTINHLDPTETIAANQFMCSNGPPGLTLASAPGGFSWVRVSYSGSKSKCLVLDHSCWEFDDDGLMRRREASINDVPIAPEDRKFLWPAGPRPAGHPGLSELGL
jgi:hypothetical protein